MSEANESLLVPFGAAFAIWLPIFCFCFAYSILQALPKNRTHPLFRRMGWWSLAGFGGVCLWGIINAFAPMQSDVFPYDGALWGTAIIFIPTMLCLVKAMLIVTQDRPNLSRAEFYTAYIGLSLISGWCSVAVFLNWTPQFVAALLPSGLAVQFLNIIMLAAALAWTVFIIRRSGQNRVYAVPVLWGLVFIAIARFTETPAHTAVGTAAAFGAILVVAASFIRAKAAA